MINGTRRKANGIETRITGYRKGEALATPSAHVAKSAPCALVRKSIARLDK
jgi:hypothetical protein